ncbi:hypothetical protein CERSUDRAFT_67540 [Gelatoporia subvermispora B]|uniref:Uncharacterized protein n=1 Tax=Ceriporiopsis subvermispora (strain B) TaxID=914234 RepID=M2R6N4_CERS8|nr:hypothetical protein CERSUDRAFT_67540 [Gelatoporia subvermispora B]
MATVPTTPKRHSAYEPTTPLGTPQTARVAGSHVIQSSPHYQTTRRHSLYGTEDRIIIDPGSRIWKVGFSGEGRPRDVFYACGEGAMPLWSLERASRTADREEEERLLEVRLQECLRSVFHNSLLTDPKSRKVIIVEHPLLPLYIKEHMARILFNNLQVPSISFASSHLLALLAAGRITGIVLDCGHLESTALPIYSSRPLFPHLRTTPLAGSRLSSHIRALLLFFGTYMPPLTSVTALTNLPASARSTRVPEEVLTDAVIEEIKTRCCFVGAPMNISETRAASPALSTSDLPSEPPSEHDFPPSDPPASESEFSRVSAEPESSVSGFSVIEPAQVPPERARPGESHLQALARMYTRHSTATDLHMRVDPPPTQQSGMGRGTLVIPGWVRERATEVLFEGGDVDESSVAEVILDSLLKAPVDLRKTLASSILVVGGTPMLPGFIPRLQAELVRAVSPRAETQTPPPNGRGRLRPAPYDRYAPLRPLLPFFAILNNPAPPPPTSVPGSQNAGKAPAFIPASMAWVGGSLAGALKTGGVEVAREKWDEADAEFDEDDPMALAHEFSSPKAILPDWTRSPLPVGAPPAPRPAPQPAMHSPSTQTAVGA